MDDHDSINSDEEDRQSYVSVDRTEDFQEYLTAWANGVPPRDWTPAKATAAVIYTFLMTPVRGGPETIDNPTIATLISKGIRQRWPRRTTGERCKVPALIAIRDESRPRRIAHNIMKLEALSEITATGHNPLVHWRTEPVPPPSNTNVPNSAPKPALTMDIVAAMIEAALKKSSPKAAPRKRKAEPEDEDEESDPPKKK
ncbi:MAG: hypothetical protein Q8N17_26430, partial [Burkholderiaceae bacterium]|nr:hypothetical protein [Burkholderiaceae bacterium]